jgi:hypothetical protein
MVQHLNNIMFEPFVRTHYLFIVIANGMQNYALKFHIIGEFHVIYTKVISQFNIFYLFFPVMW